MASPSSRRSAPGGRTRAGRHESPSRSSSHALHGGSPRAAQFPRVRTRGHCRGRGRFAPLRRVGVDTGDRGKFLGANRRERCDDPQWVRQASAAQCRRRLDDTAPTDPRRIVSRGAARIQRERRRVSSSLATDSTPGGGLQRTPAATSKRSRDFSLFTPWRSNCRHDLPRKLRCRIR